MKKLLATNLLMLSTLVAFCQNFESIVLDDKDPLGFYLAIKPNGPTEGVLVLFPGYAEAPVRVLSETKLHNTACANNILTLIVPNGPKIYADDQVISNINRALNDSIKRFELSRDKFVLGGFSAGGTIALRYAELCLEKPAFFPIRPKAVFAGDAPVDLFELWAYFDRELQRNYSEVGMAEAKMVQTQMAHDLQGTPASNPDAYSKLTPFDMRSKFPGNEKYLKDIPVRTYHDLDIDWQLKNRRRGLYDQNAAPASELISRLMLLGNNRAEFMCAKSPGFRSNGLRHTHSWSIIDEVELIQWMKDIIRS